MSRLSSFRGSKIILVASLCLNLVVVGVVAGAWLNGGQDRGARDKDQTRWAAGPYGRALSKEDRRELVQSLRRMGDENVRSQRRALKESGQQVVEALRETPFDIERVEALFAKQRGLTQNQLEIGHKLLLERIETMTPETRAAFADRLSRAWSRPRPPRD